MTCLAFVLLIKAIKQINLMFIKFFIFIKFKEVIKI